MIIYLDSVRKELLEHLDAAADTPEVDHLFKVWNDRKIQYLPDYQERNFHHTVAQLVFMSALSCQYTHTMVAFLNTRVKKPDEEYWVKLKAMLKYLKGTQNLKLTLSVDDMSVVKWWADT